MNKRHTLHESDYLRVMLSVIDIYELIAYDRIRSGEIVCRSSTFKQPQITKMMIAASSDTCSLKFGRFRTFERWNSVADIKSTTRLTEGAHVLSRVRRDELHRSFLSGVYLFTSPRHMCKHPPCSQRHPTARCPVESGWFRSQLSVAPLGKRLE